MTSNDLITKLHIMSCSEDFHHVSSIIKFNSSTKMLELGGGCAGWSIGITKILDNSPHITVVENFEFVNYSDDTYCNDWPTCESDLKQSIEVKCKQLDCDHNIQILNIDVEDVPEKLKHQTFDVIRLDCFEHTYEIDNILRWSHSSLTDNGLLCIDDIEPYITINRFMIAMDLVREKLITPVWLGQKEAIFCKWGANKNFIPEDLHCRLRKINNLMVECNNGEEYISYWAKGFER